MAPTERGLTKLTLIRKHGGTFFESPAKPWRFAKSTLANIRVKTDHLMDHEAIKYLFLHVRVWLQHFLFPNTPKVEGATTAPQIDPVISQPTIRL